MHYVSVGLNYALQHTVITSSILVGSLAWALYRLFKRISRRCTFCGSIRFHRWHEREFVRPTKNGKGVAVSVTHQACLNHHCSHFLEAIEVKAYEKEFPLEKMTC